MLAPLYSAVAVSAIVQLLICFMKKIEKKAKLLPIKIVSGTGLVMVLWMLVDTGHTFILMPLFPGTFPMPDSYIIAIVLYHVTLGIGMAWAVCMVIMRCVSGVQSLISFLKKQDE